MGSGLQIFVYDVEKEKKFPAILEMEKVKISKHSVFVGYGYLPNACDGLKRVHYLLYNMLSIQEGPNLKRDQVQWPIVR